MGFLTAEVITVLSGRSGKLSRISDSILCRQRLTSAHRTPSWRATEGSLSGPSTKTATTKMTSSFAGLNEIIEDRLYWRTALRYRGAM